MSALGAGVQYGLILPYGRNHETQADKVGLMLAAAACYNPEAAIPFGNACPNSAAARVHPNSHRPIPIRRTGSRPAALMPQAKQFYQKYCQPGPGATGATGAK